MWLIAGGVAPYACSATISVIFGLNVLVWVTGTRRLARCLLSTVLATRKPVVSYGAGEAGVQLATSLSTGGRMHRVACVDEESSLQGSTVNGVRVVAPDKLADVIRDYGVGTVLLAIPAASRRLPKAPAAAGKPTASAIQYVTDRTGHDRRYAIDARKIGREFGCKPGHVFAAGLAATVDWYFGDKHGWSALSQRR
jgi:FlaA1/EpsC-like NDP-sugar epimerase